MWTECEQNSTVHTLQCTLPESSSPLNSRHHSRSPNLARPLIGLPQCHRYGEPRSLTSASAEGVAPAPCTYLRLTWPRGPSGCPCAWQLRPPLPVAPEAAAAGQPSWRGEVLTCRAPFLSVRGAARQGGRGEARITGSWGPPNWMGGRAQDAGEDTEGLALREKERRRNGQKQLVTVPNATST